MMDRRRFFLSAAAGFSAVALPGAERLQGPDAVLQALRDGNRRFAANHARHPHSGIMRVRQTWKDGQHPQAVVLCCSDSRVVPELLFDQGIGDLFSVRVAGNVANEDELASIEYAVEHLHVGVCVVLGHYECGAVTAVVKGDHLPAELEHLVAHIRTAENTVRQDSPALRDKALIEATVRANVWQSIHDLFAQGAPIRELVRLNRLKVVGGVYRIADGRVDWMGAHPDEAKLIAGTTPH